MSDYSDQSKRLAHELAAKASRNLARWGVTVTQEPDGRYIVRNPASGDPADH